MLQKIIKCILSCLLSFLSFFKRFIVSLLVRLRKIIKTFFIYLLCCLYEYFISIIIGLIEAIILIVLAYLFFILATTIIYMGWYNKFWNFNDMYHDFFEVFSYGFIWDSVVAYAIVAYYAEKFEESIIYFRIMFWLRRKFYGKRVKVGNIEPLFISHSLEIVPYKKKRYIRRGESSCEDIVLYEIKVLAPNPKSERLDIVPYVFKALPAPKCQDIVEYTRDKSVLIPYVFKALPAPKCQDIVEYTRDKSVLIPYVFKALPAPKCQDIVEFKGMALSACGLGPKIGYGFGFVKVFTGGRRRVYNNKIDGYVKMMLLTLLSISVRERVLFIESSLEELVEELGLSSEEAFEIILLIKIILIICVDRVYEEGEDLFVFNIYRFFKLERFFLNKNISNYNLSFILPEEYACGFPGNFLFCREDFNCLGFFCLDRVSFSKFAKSVRLKGDICGYKTGLNFTSFNKTNCSSFVLYEPKRYSSFSDGLFIATVCGVGFYPNDLICKKASDLSKIFHTFYLLRGDNEGLTWNVLGGPNTRVYHLVYGVRIEGVLFFGNAQGGFLVSDIRDLRDPMARPIPRSVEEKAKFRMNLSIDGQKIKFWEERHGGENGISLVFDSFNKVRYWVSPSDYRRYFERFCSFSDGDGYGLVNSFGEGHVNSFSEIKVRSYVDLFSEGGWDPLEDRCEDNYVQMNVLYDFGSDWCPKLKTLYGDRDSKGKPTISFVGAGNLECSCTLSFKTEDCCLRSSRFGLYDDGSCQELFVRGVEALPPLPSWAGGGDMKRRLNLMFERNLIPNLSFLPYYKNLLFLAYKGLYDLHMFKVCKSYMDVEDLFNLGGSHNKVGGEIEKEDFLRGEDGEVNKPYVFRRVLTILEYNGWRGSIGADDVLEDFGMKFIDNKKEQSAHKKLFYKDMKNRLKGNPNYAGSINIRVGGVECNDFDSICKNFLVPGREMQLIYFLKNMVALHIKKMLSKISNRVRGRARKKIMKILVVIKDRARVSVLGVRFAIRKGRKVDFMERKRLERKKKFKEAEVRRQKEIEMKKKSEEKKGDVILKEAFIHNKELWKYNSPGWCNLEHTIWNKEKEGGAYESVNPDILYALAGKAKKTDKLQREVNFKILEGTVVKKFNKFLDKEDSSVSTKTFEAVEEKGFERRKPLYEAKFFYSGRGRRFTTRKVAKEYVEKGEEKVEEKNISVDGVDEGVEDCDF